jgi:signal transduction histidine kinase/response regulator RpfG family c-di-GMP phosphodiesterase
VVDDYPSIHEDFRKILSRTTPTQNELNDLESEIFGSEADSTFLPAFELSFASQGKEAVEMVVQAKKEGRPFALAFVDGRMPPGWDGIETINRIWEISPDIQAVLCTAHSDYSWEEIRRILGESDSLLILKKPFDNEEVLQLAHALTRKWELNREVEGRLSNLDALVCLKTEESRQTLARLEAALENSPAGIIITDAKGEEIHRINPSAANICGLTNPLISRSNGGEKNQEWNALRTDGEPYPDGELPLECAINKGTIVQDQEIMLRNNRNQVKWISANAAPIYASDGAVSGGILVFQDITLRKESELERKRLQDQLIQAQKMEAIGTLAGGVAHDLNNILSGLVSYPELLLLELPTDSPMRGAIETIQKSGQKAATIVQDLLTLARRGVPTDTVLNLNQVVTDYLASPEHDKLSEFHDQVRIEAELEPKLLDIKGSPVHLSKTVMNLISNAAESMPNGGRIKISTKNLYVDRPIGGYDMVEEGDYTMLKISDEGIGISPEDRERIFEPFFTKKAMGRSGTGLGMAVVWSTVKDHNGYIDLKSDDGQGTRIALYFPVTKESRLAVDKTIGIEDLMGSGQSILVIDDVEQQRQIARKMLEKLGYKVLLSPSGEHAVEYLGHHRVDLIVLDMIMDPGIDGLETYRRITTLHPHQKAVITSGYSETARVRKNQQLGAGLYIKKPYSIIDLGKAVRDTLRCR